MDSNKAQQIRNKIHELASEFYREKHLRGAGDGGGVGDGGNFVPGQSKVHYAGRIFDEKEIINGVDAVLDFWLTLGDYGDQFEEKLKKYLGVRDVILVNSGSSANLVAISALLSSELENPLRPGDEVLTPAVTFPSTLSPLVLSGLVPVFLDCELGTYNIDCSKLESAFSPKLRAIMIPHTLGNLCDMDKILAFAKKHSLYLIEDSCDALGSKWNGKFAGTFGDMGTISFYPAHHITMGEGGAIVTNNGRLAKILRSVRDWGRDCWCKSGVSDTCQKRFGWKLGDLPYGYDHKYVYSHIGYNLKPTDIQAAIGLAQLDKLPDFVEKRKQNFKRIYEVFSKYSDWLILPKWENLSDPSWFGFPITVKENAPFTRNELTAHLEKNRIETRLLFAGNILRQPAYKNIAHRLVGKLSNSDTVANQTFFIGVYPGITAPMVQYIDGVAAQFFSTKIQKTGKL